MRERSISEDLMRSAIEQPTKIEYDLGRRMLIKKLYWKAGKTRLLLIVCEETKNIIEIITIIDTSKVKKYL